MEPGVLTPGMREHKEFLSPGGTTLIPQIPFVVIDPMFDQQPNEFVLERGFSVMLLLTADVPSHTIDLRFAHAERSVTGLPGETGRAIGAFVDPLGRMPFDALQHLRDGDGRFELGEQMNMIHRATNFQQVPAFASNNTSKVSIQFRLPGWLYQVAPLSRAKHNVVQQVGERTRHDCTPACSSAPPGRMKLFGPGYQGLKALATRLGPCGTNNDVENRSPKYGPLGSRTIHV